MTEEAMLISAFIPFPNIYWWAKAAQYGTVCFDGYEHFQKMSYRNRYYISGSNGLITLSIPLVEGREQRTAMKDVLISNKDKWQVQHWRTLTSVYKRSPYFDFYEHDLERLYTIKFEKLADFNLASIQWLKQQLKLDFKEIITDSFEKEAADEDMRWIMKPGVERTKTDAVAYYQVFADRTGFLPNLSLLDLLFSEGPRTLQWLKENQIIINGWNSKV